VLQAGTLSTIQDYPGRVGFWHVGVPPSGPMDTLAFRLANRLLDNPAAAAGLEITLNGPTLRFNCTSQVAITGVAIEASLDGVSAPLWEVIDVAAGQVLQLGKVAGDGARSYLAVRGGLQCPEYLGSHATFILGQFGGHAGRTLRAGDVLHLPRVFESTPLQVIALGARPVHPEVWQLRVIYGPHGAPDFFTEKDIAEFFEHPWSVHHNSSRTGVRLIGPHPRWARSTGGEAGLHPSNIHDNAYAFGTVDFTGDMPVILGPDGPSLGGFVCPATVIQADLWKLGQLTAGAQVRFVPVSHADAVALEQAQHQAISQLSAVAAVVATAPIAIERLGSPVIKRDSMNGEPVVYRLAGDHFVLLELGPLELDIERRFRIHALMRWLQDQPLSGMRELTPGIRSLQVHYDSQVLALDDLLAHLQRATAAMGSQQDLSVPSRIVHLPLSWDDEACRQAIDKYQQSVRPDAPWCPSNLEFIRRINGLADIDAVRDIVFNASYLVMGLGDVYLGAPVATPLDPRQRLVTTKYNPARTWTAENSVGIGGAYLCVYGMEGPGGYQFVGRTLQMWNRYRKTAAFEQPWLLRFFDQIRFYPVSTEELHQIRQDFPLGKYPLRVEDSTFSLAEYRSYLSSHEDAIATFQQQREDAFADELERWKASGQLNFQQQHPVAEEAVEALLPAGTTSADSPVSGSVWQVLVAEEQQVAAGEPLMILESMKMEIEVFAPHAGRVKRLLKRQGQSVTAGQALLWLEQSQ
jgi:urea carboxylase